MYCPLHTRIIEASMKYRNKRRGYISSTMQNIIFHECGDSDIINSKIYFVDPALMFSQCSIDDKY